MPIRVKCESCKKTLSVKDHLAGKKIKCPVCQNVVVVPNLSEPQAPPAKPEAGSAGAPPKAGPAPKAPVGKKPAVTAKPTLGKVVAEKTATNGTPANGTAKSNGVPAKPPEPAPVELPPENVEEEALAALADEPPPPPEETGPAPTIDFKCQWCDEEVSLPIDMAGKQTQCPHAECRRIIKVPMPKIEAKKDWRKMDRKGPAAAIINQPEELENAWGTETTTRARQDSLAQAGAVAEKPKPPIGAFAWTGRILRVGIVVALVGAAVAGVSRLRETSQQKKAIVEINELVKGDNPKIKNRLLRAEAHRTLGLLHLREPSGATEAMYQFQGSLGLVIRQMEDNDTPAKDGRSKEPGVNEQLFLIELALSQIELGGDGDDLLTKKKKPWEDVRKELASTLEKIQSPDVQVLALREIGTRLNRSGQASMAYQLAGNLSNPDANRKYPTAYRQQIALLYATGETEAQKTLPKEPDLAGKEPIDVNLRVGFAEGYARKDKYEAAMKLATAPGAPKDRMEACMGIASVALQDPTKKDKAVESFKEALKFAGDKNVNPTPWQQLRLIQMAVRMDDIDSVKDQVAKLPASFKLRAQYEIFLGKLEMSGDAANPNDLADLEANDKDGVTLALAWEMLARMNRASRDQNRKTLAARLGVIELPPEFPELLRPLVDLGSYLGPPNK